MKRKTFVTFNHPLTFGPRPSKFRRWLAPAMALPLLVGMGYTVSKQMSASASKPVPAASASLAHASGHGSKTAAHPENRVRPRR